MNRKFISKSISNKEKKEKNIKEWWHKNRGWITIIGGTVGTVIVAGFISYISNIVSSANYMSEEDRDTSEDFGYKPPIDEKYWNPSSQNWEKNGNPYTYRVSYTDCRDGENHEHNYDDIDNGYEDYLYYKRQWYTKNTAWDHIEPEE